MGKGDTQRPYSVDGAEYTKRWDETFAKKKSPCERCRGTGIQWKPLPNPNEAWVSTSCPDCLPDVESD